MLSMSRYTEWLKEPIICSICDCIITRGHRIAHIKTKKHQFNMLNNDIDDNQSNQTNKNS